MSTWLAILILAGFFLLVVVPLLVLWCFALEKATENDEWSHYPKKSYYDKNGNLIDDWDAID